VSNHSESVPDQSESGDPSAIDVLESDRDLQSSGVRLNIEIKARCSDHQSIRDILELRGARTVGEDHQIDTYFNVEAGRLKLREGNIENSLIFYHRPDSAGPKRSDVLLYRVAPDPSLKEVLGASLGIKVVVDKRREIFFDENVKIHLDRVQGLGAFLEIEAIDADGTRTEEELKKQCDSFMDLFSVQDEDLVEKSYSDLLMS